MHAQAAQGAITTQVCGQFQNRNRTVDEDSDGRFPDDRLVEGAARGGLLAGGRGTGRAIRTIHRCER